MNQKYDYSQLFARNIRVYKIFGFWRPNPDMKHKKLYHCYTAFWVGVSLTFLLTQVVYINNNRNNVKELAATLYITLTFASILARTLISYKGMHKLQLIIKQLNRPLFQVKCYKHYEIAEGTNRKYKMLYDLCLFLGATTDVLGALFPLFAKERVILANAWFPYDWTKTFNYYVTYIFQSLVLTWHTLICFAMDVLIFTLLVQVGVQCDILCYTLNHLDDFYVQDGVLYEVSKRNKFELRRDMEEFSKAMSKNLVVCAQHHGGIVKLANDLQQITGNCIFILFTSGTLILCTCVFQLSEIQFGSVESMMLLFFLTCMFTEQFLYCWFGNEVKYKGSLILQSAYNTPWVDCNTKFRKILLQFMTQACRPFAILAGGLFEVSVPVFTSVVRTSYSYYTLLQRIR